MKKVLTVSILAVMLVLMMVTGVNAVSSDNLAATLYSKCSKYGMTNADKVKINRYLKDHPVSAEEADAIVAKADAAVAVMKDADVTNYKQLTEAQKDKVKSLASEAAKIANVTLAFKAGKVEVYDEDGKLIESVSTSNDGKLAYTGNNNIVLVVSSIAVIALATVAVAGKKLANA